MSYAKKHDMVYFEVSGLCDFNVTESLTELSRLVLKRNGLDRLWSTTKGLAEIELLIYKSESGKMYSLGRLF